MLIRLMAFIFAAAPMLLAECYVVSEILLLIKPRQGGALAAFNKASAYAAALGIARREACGLLRRALRPCARMVTLRP